MYSNDREQFNIHVSVLCAGYNVPCNQDRLDAYWQGCQKMSIIEFGRCVEFALGPEGPEKIPTTRAIWNIRRQLRAPVHHQTIKASDTRDHIEFFANRLLLRFWINHAGFGSDGEASELLQKLLKAKRSTIDWFYRPILEQDEIATHHAFVEDFTRAVSKICDVDEETKRQWNELQSQTPFPAFMVRELPSTQPS